MKYYGIMALLAAMMLFTSCEVSIDWYDDDDYSEMYYQRTRELCSRTWQESWVQNGEIHTQRLDFYEDRTGTELMRIEHRDGYITEDRYSFRWSWENSSQTALRMNYGGNDYSYFENIWLSGNTLSGILDDVDVRLTGIN